MTPIVWTKDIPLKYISPNIILYVSQNKASHGISIWLQYEHMSHFYDTFMLLCLFWSLKGFGPQLQFILIAWKRATSTVFMICNFELYIVNVMSKWWQSILEPQWFQVYRGNEDNYKMNNNCFKSYRSHTIFILVILV